MMGVKLSSGVTLDAHSVEVEPHTITLLDRNGDVMNHVGQPLVESIEQL